MRDYPFFGFKFFVFKTATTDENRHLTLREFFKGKNKMVSNVFKMSIRREMAKKWVADRVAAVSPPFLRILKKI